MGHGAHYNRGIRNILAVPAVEEVPISGGAAADKDALRSIAARKDYGIGHAIANAGDNTVEHKRPIVVNMVMLMKLNGLTWITINRLGNSLAMVDTQGAAFVCKKALTCHVS